MYPHPHIQEETTLPGAKIRCVLAHDHVLLRQGLRRLLQDEPDIDVVSEAGDAAECLREVSDLRPDVLVTDAATFGMPAPEAELLVKRESNQTRIVFLSAQEDARAQFRGLRVVGGNCAVRGTSGAELVEMVRTACGNAGNRNAAKREGAATGPHNTAMRRDPRTTSGSPGHALTAREQEVLKLLAEGKTVRGAAILLGLSSKTVDAHKFNLMRKLGIHNKAELVMWAIQMRVVKVPVNL